MKIYHFLILVLFSTCLTIVSCKDNKDASTTEGQTVDSLGGIIPATDPAMTATPSATGAGSEPHYKCTKDGCAGTGTGAGKCPICGTELVHNQAFHAQAAGAAGAAGSSPDNPVQVTQSGGTPTPTTPNATPTPPSAQNAKGEYHYKCSKGHAGAASAGNCGTCGEPLTHNQAFHAN